ncbi:LacI family DNA-binding transcriptional regulator [Demequina lutea]|uniref:LacI family DNA-binding transcriptional regulator n=1 Tax=Demequina lutea TaxID=431489 RepID=UPI000B2FAE40|nr:LacI family DNA-binding transcriptional regulator [Demequina lutea]
MAYTARRSSQRSGPSIVDVARLAGVSGQTVSRVSNQPDAVKPATRDRVLIAMEQLGYSPNLAARALRHGRYGTIGLLAHRFDRTGEAATTDAVLRAAAENDLTVTILTVPSTDADGWTPAAKRLQHQATDGLIVIRNELESVKRLTFPAGFPVVVSDHRMEGVLPCVVADEIAATRAAVDYLMDLGHRTVHHVAGPQDSEPARRREIGWRARLRERGAIAYEPLPGDWTAESGFRAGRTLAANPEVTAVFCANDEMAFGVLHALHDMGRRVPGDVSVIGFDGIPLGVHSYPPLTTLKQDFRTIGAELVRLLVDQINNENADHAPHVIVPIELVVRKSTAPPPPAS